MLQTVEAVINKKGIIKPLEEVHFHPGERVLVTILGEKPIASKISDTALLSEPALAKDWAKPEEDKAWAHLR